jgi:hypothetical protein
MKSYEIRVVDETGIALIYQLEHPDDRAAIEAAIAFAQDRAFDLWRGMDCLFIGCHASTMQ